MNINMNMNSQEAKRWYLIACEYLELDRRDTLHPLAPVEYRPGVRVVSLPAKTVRLALCCELLMKSVLALEGKNIKKIHGLDELFSMIDERTRGTIEKRLGVLDPENSDDLESRLKSCSNCFVSLRYRADRDEEAYSAAWPLLRRLSRVLDDYVYDALYSDGR